MTRQKRDFSKWLRNFAFAVGLYILKKLYGLYTDLPVEDGEDLKKNITKCFNVKYVKCEDAYASLNYFESYESDVTEPETRFEAMASLIDGSCIEKGTYLYPHNNK